VTLAEDLELIRSETGLSDNDLMALVRDEHQRYDFYVRALALAPPPDDRMFLRIVLRDPDTVMGEAAAVEFAAKQAQQHPSYRSFASWAQAVSDITNSHHFLSRRIREWSDFKRLMEGGDFDTEFFDASSDWLQLKLARELTSPDHLAKLAEFGRTKRVRNTSRRRADQIYSIGP
jgi:hypothetical protein